MFFGRLAGCLFLWTACVLARVHAADSDETVKFLGKWDVPVHELPLVAGSPRAAHWVVMFSKWNCQICGMMDQSWKDALGDDPAGKVGVVMLPGVPPTGPDPLQKIMLAVWRENPQVYRDVAALIHDGGLDPARPAAVRAQLAGFLGGDGKLAAIEAKHADWASRQLELATNILKDNAAGADADGSFPKWMTPEKIGTGHLGKLEHYQEFIRSMGWPLPGIAPAECQLPAPQSRAPQPSQ